MIFVNGKNYLSIAGLNCSMILTFDTENLTFVRFPYSRFSRSKVVSTLNKPLLTITLISFK